MDIDINGMPGIDDLRNGWKDDGISDEDVEKLTELYYQTTDAGAQDQSDSMDVPEKPTSVEDAGDDSDEESSPSDTPSEPPMPQEPEPENPEDRKYNPERNVDESGGGVGSDPMCKPVFEPSVARMKRGETFDVWVPGGQEGYEARISHDKLKLRDVTLATPTDINKYKLFKGKVDIGIASGTPTPLYMPSDEVNISEYVCSDGSDLTFRADGLNNVYVQAVTGIKRTVTLNYSVWCLWSGAINNLQYYDQIYNDSYTVQDAYLSASTIDYDFSNVLDSTFRRNVPFGLGVIHDKYFKEFIDILGKMTVPGLPGLDTDKLELENVRKKYNFKKVISVIAGHCMSYGCKDIPLKGDMVLTCIRSREGACRNRALVFYVMATTLGIPTRYCCSDCHAYVEVYFGNTGKWVGMDLGGCSPPQPDDDDKPEPPDKDDVIARFADILKSMGWSETEPRYMTAINGARAFN